MKTKILILALLTLFAFSCKDINNQAPPDDTTTVDSTKTDSITLPKVAVGEDENGNIIYAKTQENLFFKGKPDGKGQKPRVIMLKPSLTNTLNRALSVRIMKDPINYTGTLPIANNNGWTDFDGDGQVNDSIAIEKRCYFPRTFSEVVVYIGGTEKHVINNSIAYGAKLLGFLDTNLDGILDIIWEGGNHRKFNADDDGVIEAYSQYNVGIVEDGAPPIPLSEQVASLTLAQSTKNPNFVRWDLGKEYEAYVFHVWWMEENGIGWLGQTHTYPEFGIQYSNFQAGITYIIGFSNLDEKSEDGCGDIIVSFTP